MPLQDDLRDIIRSIRESVPDVSGVMIASTDGLSIANDLPEQEAARVAAMSATALGLGKRICDTNQLGGMQETVVRGNSGYLIIYAAGDRAVLAVNAPNNGNLGLIHLEARTAAGRITEAMAG